MGRYVLFFLFSCFAFLYYLFDLSTVFGTFLVIVIRSYADIARVFFFIFYFIFFSHLVFFWCVADLSSWNIEFSEVFPIFSLQSINQMERLFLAGLKYNLFISGSQCTQAMMQQYMVCIFNSLIFLLYLYALYLVRFHSYFRVTRIRTYVESLV